MEKKIAALLGTVAALGTVASAQAAPAPVVASDVLRANSYAELLEPISNAGALLQAMDEQQSGVSQEGNIQSAQFYHHHHHHHHHHHYRGPGFVIRTPFGAYGRYYHHHHHHHHHHSYYYDRY